MNPSFSFMPPANHCTDGYKLGHADQYPPGTQSLLFNLTGRNFKYLRQSRCVLPDFDNRMVVAGAGHISGWYLKDYWHATFFKQPREQVIQEFAEEATLYLGEPPKKERWGELHDLGFLPLILFSLPEGCRVREGVPHLLWHATRPEFAWLAGFIETPLSTEYWSLTTGATIAFEFRRLMEYYAQATNSPKEFVTWQGHDFSYRGLRGIIDGAHRQICHLFSFRGTDTFPAIRHARRYYRPTNPNEIIGCSVNATEHSTTSSNIQWEYHKLTTGTHEEKLLEAEYNFLTRLLTEVYHTGVVSYVSDTHDHFALMTQVLPRLRDIILNREPNALGLVKYVTRGDSGDPLKIVCGDPEAPVGSPEHKGSLQILWEIFGGTTDEDGFRILHPKVGMIYGDGINVGLAHQIFRRMKELGWASCNLVDGVGSFTYQYHTRDDTSMAVKTTQLTIDGKKIDLYKDPKTARAAGASKHSAKGGLDVVYREGDYILLEGVDSFCEETAFEVSFCDGLVIPTPLDIVRNRLDSEVHYDAALLA
jgi:nicotinamide phosphoribosyltransferase